MLVFVFDMNRVMGSHKPNKGTLWLVKKKLAIKAHHINIMYEDATLNIPDLFCVCVTDHNATFRLKPKHSMVTLYEGFKDHPNAKRNIEMMPCELTFI